MTEQRTANVQMPILTKLSFQSPYGSYRSPGTRTESGQWYRTLTPFQSNVPLPASRLRNCTRGSAHVTDFPVDVSLLFHTADRILHCSQSLCHIYGKTTYFML